MKEHKYVSDLKWEGKYTENYHSYSRDFVIDAVGKGKSILGSSDPAFKGDPQRYNPEDLFLSSISSCHMLWYLHLCAVNNISVVSYRDRATGTMKESENGSGKFTSVVLHPEIVVQTSEMLKRAMELHHEANRMCFIANSCNFKIEHEAKIEVLKS